MTRINLVKVQELTDQHLMAEYREIFHIPASLKRSLSSKKMFNPKEIPQRYTLGTGHVKFFYDKGMFLEKRNKEIYTELVNRKYKVNYKEYPTGIFQENSLYNDYIPSEEEINTNIGRIQERIAAKPWWYRRTKY